MECLKQTLGVVLRLESSLTVETGFQSLFYSGLLRSWSSFSRPLFVLCNATCSSSLCFDNVLVSIAKVSHELTVLFTQALILCGSH